MNKYEKLFERASIGSMQLKNRVILPPMATLSGNPETNFPSEETIAYYEARAKGGYGMICVEHTCVTPAGIYGPGVLIANPSTCVPHFKKLFDVIHKHGAKAIAQLGDGGTSAHPKCNGNIPTVSASSTPDHRIRLFPHEISIEGIQEYKKAYLSAVDNMIEAGVDAIILHLANGYFLASFLSTRENKRTDRYGGTMEGRLRLILEIVDDIKRKYGNRITLFTRMAAFEERYGRNTEETMVIAKALEKAGVEAISFNAGSYFELYHELPPYTEPQGYIMDHIAKLKKGLKVPVFGGGRVTEPLLADSYLIDGKVDFIEIGRGGIADPEWCNKAQSGQSDSIRRCIGCCRCCDLIDGKHGCSVNPYAFKETKYSLEKAETKKKILVVGGGIGGLQTSITASEKGHDVVVVEKNTYLGGNAKAAAMPINKGEIVSLVTSLAEDARKLGVEIVMNTTVDVDFVNNMNPDLVVVATGATPIPCTFIQGHEEANFVDAIDFLMGKGMESIPRDANIAVIGGGAIGLETAEFLAVYENSVDVYEMESNINMALVINTADYEMIKNVKKYGVGIKLGHKVLSVNEGVLSYESNGQVGQSKKYDYFISAVGLRSNNQLAKELETAGFQTLLVGDAKEPSRFMEVLTDGLETALQIN
jgi:2,4-dienoyl-CoA reductase-like NADH-dependent reductase (Old Yellow Enzyme family)/thioredoxin reductase